MDTSLTILNETVESMEEVVYNPTKTTLDVDKLHYKASALTSSVKVWPQRHIDGLDYSLCFSAENECVVAIWNTPSAYEYAYEDGEDDWQQLTGNLAFGGSLGNVHLRSRNRDSALFRVLELAGTTPWIVSGEVESIMGLGDPTWPEWAMRRAFEGCIQLIDAWDLHFPETEPISMCWMFKDCSSLKRAPLLKCAYMYEQGCEEMFMNCTSLTDVRDIEVGNIANGGFVNAFSGCTSLQKAPALLNVNWIDINGCSHMFENCTALVEVPDLPNVPIRMGGCSNMFKNCRALVNAPELPSHFLDQGAYGDMFYDCVELVNGPSELPASNPGIGCYQNMFKGCAKLAQQPNMDSLSKPEASCCMMMFADCVSLTKAKINGVAWVPSPYTSSNVEYLRDHCFQAMFARCTGITDITVWVTQCGPAYFEDWIAGVRVVGKPVTVHCRPDCTLYSQPEGEAHDGMNFYYDWTVIR